MGSLNEALDCYKKAIAICSDNAFAYNNMAVIYLDMLEVDNAIKAADEALKIKQNMYQVIFN